MTDAAFDAAFRIVVGEEGGYDADPRDAGNYTGGAVGAGTLGGTKYGWTSADWASNLAQMPADVRAQMPAVPADLTLDQAKLAYRSLQWRRVAGDALPDPLALMLFDAAVNQGIRQPSDWLEDAVGTNEDGDIGPLTVAAVLRADVLDTLAEVAWRRDCSYRQDGGWATYGHGWIKRLATITALSLVYTQDAALARYLPHGVVT